MNKLAEKLADIKHCDQIVRRELPKRLGLYRETLADIMYGRISVDKKTRRRIEDHIKEIENEVIPRKATIELKESTEAA